MAEVNKKRVSIIGEGSWATAITHIISQNDIEVNWWVRKPETLDFITKFKRNPNYLTSVQINEKIVTPFLDINECIKNTDIVFFVVPAAFIEKVLDRIDPEVLKGKILVSAIKGMMPEHNCIVTEYLANTFKIPNNNLCIVGGPCHAEEVALNRQSYLTIGCDDLANAGIVAKILSNQFVNVHCEQDLIGIEYAAVMKNIIALASGITHGLNYGDNFQAVLVSNAMQEIERFLNHFHPAKRNLLGSAYLGDLLVTAYSQFSRNRTFGGMIGRGYTVKSTMLEMNMVAEGYYASNSINEIIKDIDIEMPITRAVYHILYEKISPAIEMQLLKGVLK